MIKQEMIEVKPASYIYRCVHRIMEGDCQMDHGPRLAEVKSIRADKYAVTNAMYYDFVQASGYQPENTINYLKHWENGKYKSGEEDLPVVNVSQNDAKAYAAYYQKRLPTEEEWQYLASGSENYRYPWGNRKDYAKCNVYGTKLMPVDSHPDGASPFGLYNMCGNVWEYTSDTHFDGDRNHYFIVLRGGSYYSAPDYWHTECGAVPNSFHLKVHQLGDAMNRYETVGFRCVQEM